MQHGPMGTSGRRERIAAAIAVSLLVLWKAGVLAWGLANPVEIGPVGMDFEGWRETLRDLGRESHPRDESDEGERLGVPAGLDAPGDHDVLDRAIAVDDRGAEPSDDDAAPSRDLVIGADPAPPSLDDLRAALRARGTEEAEPASLGDLDLPPVVLDAVEPGEIELRVSLEDEHAEELSDAPLPDVPFVLWVDWLVWAVLLALVSLALAALGRAMRSAAAIASAACFGALAIGTAISMWTSHVGLYWAWLDALAFPLLGAAAALGTWAASAPRVGPIASVAAGIALQLFATALPDGAWVVPLVLGTCTPLVALAFALRPQTTTQPTAPADVATAPVRAALATVAVLVGGSVALVVAASATRLGGELLGIVDGLSWAWPVVLQSGCAVVLTAIARAQRTSPGASSWRMAAVALWAMTIASTALGISIGTVEAPPSVGVPLLVVAFLACGAWLPLVDRAIRRELRVPSIASQNVVLALAALPVAWVVGARHAVRLGALPTLALCVWASIATTWWLMTEHARAEEREARADDAASDEPIVEEADDGA